VKRDTAVEEPRVLGAFRNRSRYAQADALLSAGRQLREMRESVGLTLRDVELASSNFAESRGLEEFALPSSRLSDIESKGLLPSIYRLYVLSVLYRVSWTELLRLYGIDLSESNADFSIGRPSRTHRISATEEIPEVRMPVKLDPAFDSRTTMNLGRMIEHWGVVPLQYLQALSKTPYSYGYIGSEDYTMYPLLLPGSFIQIDESRNHVEEGSWRSEYERPIYFVETREGFICCWCSLKGNDLVLQSHPLSSVPPRIMKNESEAEVLGQVVGVAMRLGEGFGPPQTGKQSSPGSGAGGPKEGRRR